MSHRTALVCCSGIACDELYWTLLAPALSSERAVITWDYPYHGDSGPAGDPSEIEVRSLARHAAALVRHLQAGRVAFTGHSMGVQVMLEMFRLYPEKVSGMISIAGPYRHTVGNLYGTPAGRLILEAMGAAVRAQPELTQMFWRLAVSPQFADPVGRLGGLIGRAPPRLMDRYFRHLQTLDVGVLVEMFRAGQQHTAGDILEEISVPVLILHGTHDVMTPLALAQEMAQRIPGAELVAVDGGAHTLPIDDPPLIHREVSRFLRKKVDVELRS